MNKQNINKLLIAALIAESTFIAAFIALILLADPDQEAALCAYWPYFFY